MGYGNKTVRIDFTELSDPDSDPIFVTILNPRLVSQDRLTPNRDLELTPDGKAKDMQAAAESTYEVIAGLIRDWNVFDPDDLSDDAPPFPLPATTELVHKLPVTIQKRIMELVGEAIAPKS